MVYVSSDMYLCIYACSYKLQLCIYSLNMLKYVYIPSVMFFFYFSYVCIPVYDPEILFFISGRRQMWTRVSRYFPFYNILLCYFNFSYNFWYFNEISSHFEKRNIRFIKLYYILKRPRRQKTPDANVWRLMHTYDVTYVRGQRRYHLFADLF